MEPTLINNKNVNGTRNARSKVRARRMNCAGRTKMRAVAREREELVVRHNGSKRTSAKGTEGGARSVQVTVAASVRGRCAARRGEP